MSEEKSSVLTYGQVWLGKGMTFFFPHTFRSYSALVHDWFFHCANEASKQVREDLDGGWGGVGGCSRDIGQL